MAGMGCVDGTILKCFGSLSKYFRISFDLEVLGTFCVTEEFTKLFDKYLKLDNQFMLKRFFRWKK